MSSSRCTLAPGLVTDLVKDVVFVTIGFGVLAFQRAQVLRRELLERLQQPVPSRPA